MPDSITNSWNAIRAFCSSLPPGPQDDVAQLERLLASCWDDLGAADDGMEGYKLIHRMESVVWEVPVLRFAIERHGGTVLGSTRAELQHWEVDVCKETLWLAKIGHRQLMPMAERVYAKPLVEELLHAIRAGESDDRITWNGTDQVRLMTLKMFPKGSGFVMTVRGRRKRLREGVAKALLKEGWERVGNDRFRRRSYQVAASRSIAEERVEQS